MQAVILKIMQFYNQGRTATFFTETRGLVRVNIRKSTANNLSPLTLMEIHLQKAQGEYYTLGDFSLIDPILEIRESLDRLNAGAHMAKLLLNLHFPEKPSPQLFTLFKAYLLRLKESSNPSLLAASFSLKLLKHEGVFPLEKEDFFMAVSEEEWLISQLLAHSRSFSALEELSAPSLIERLNAHVGESVKSF
jgi:DNA repair protein RecO